jgi:transcriptional regulator
VYIPTLFREDDRDTLVAFMRAHSFATVVSIIDGVPFATHIPVTVETRDDTVVLTGHVAKANPHTAAFVQPVQAGREQAPGVAPTLAVFAGPHAYVSPTVYESKESVPTWNYIAVHALGVPVALHAADSPAEMDAMLNRMIAQYDPSYAAQWQGLSPKYRNGMMQGVVAFEMLVTSIEGKYKLSQNRNAHDRAAVAQYLEAQRDPSSFAVAAEMRARS